MNKITFKDLPSTETPINAENLNLMQDNIESAVNENAEKIESHYIPANIQEEQAWYLALSGNIVGHQNNAFILSIQQITNGSAGQLYANIRCWNENTLDLREFKWLSNTGLNSSDFKLKLDGNNYYLYMRTSEAYGQYQIKVVQSSDTPVTQGNVEDILTFYAPLANDTVEGPDGISPSFKNQKILWYDPTGSLMMSTQTAQLNEKVSEQKNGIVLVFSAFSDGTSHDWNWSTHFIPKKMLEIAGDGYGQGFIIPDSYGGIMAAKYLLINDLFITGHGTNIGEQGGINNSKAVLRYVLGV